MRLNPAAFDAFLVTGGDAIGQDFIWRPSRACPCVNANSGAANPKCPQCSGKGRLWLAGVHAKAGMTAQQNIKKFGQMGLYEMGDATLTIPQASAMYGCDQFDRVVMLNSTERFSLVLKRGGPAEKVFRTRVVSVEPVFWLDDLGQVVTGGTPTLALDGTPSWTSGAPPLGTTYTITGVSCDEYFVWNNMVSDRGEHMGAALPRKCIVRKFDLFGR